MYKDDSPTNLNPAHPPTHPPLKRVDGNGMEPNGTEWNGMGMDIFLVKGG